MTTGKGDKERMVYNTNSKNRFITKGPYQGITTENDDGLAKNYSPQRREQKQRQPSPHQFRPHQAPKLP